MFSGTGRLADAWRRSHTTRHIPIFEFDLKWGPAFDLTLRRVQRIVRGWLRGGLVSVLWLGTPCNSFSRARERGGNGPPPLRSNEYPMGLPDLRPHDHEKVRVGNLLATFSAGLMNLGRSLGVPCVTENPATSRLWLTPGYRRLMAIKSVRSIHTDYSGYGMPWRKRTKLVSIHADLTPSARHCIGKGVCSFTSRPHVRLEGQQNGVFMTLIAEPFPCQMCNALVRCLHNSLVSMKLRSLDAYCS